MGAAYVLARTCWPCEYASVSKEATRVFVRLTTSALEVRARAVHHPTVGCWPLSCTCHPSLDLLRCCYCCSGRLVGQASAEAAAEQELRTCATRHGLTANSGKWSRAGSTGPRNWSIKLRVTTVKRQLQTPSSNHVVLDGSVSNFKLQRFIDSQTNSCICSNVGADGSLVCFGSLFGV